MINKQIWHDQWDPRGVDQTKKKTRCCPVELWQRTPKRGEKHFTTGNASCNGLSDDGSPVLPYLANSLSNRSRTARKKNQKKRESRQSSLNRFFGSVETYKLTKRNFLTSPTHSWTTNNLLLWISIYGRIWLKLVPLWILWSYVSAMLRPHPNYHCRHRKIWTQRILTRQDAIKRGGYLPLLERVSTISPGKWEYIQPSARVVIEWHGDEPIFLFSFH